MCQNIRCDVFFGRVMTAAARLRLRPRGLSIGRGAGAGAGARLVGSCLWPAASALALVSFLPASPSRPCTAAAGSALRWRDCVAERTGEGSAVCPPCRGVDRPVPAVVRRAATWGSLAGWPN